MLPCAAFAGPPEPAFSFSAFLLPAHSLLRGGADFLSSHLAAAPGFVHNWLTRLQQGVFGASLVRSSTRLSKPHTGSHRCEFGFFLQNEFTLPLKGEELGIVCLVRRSFHAEKPGAFPQEKRDASYPRASLAVAFGNCWPQLAHTPPTGPVRGCAGVTSLPGFQNRTQGRTGAGLVSACWLAILRKIAFRNPV